MNKTGTYKTKYKAVVFSNHCKSWINHKINRLAAEGWILDYIDNGIGYFKRAE